MLDIAIIGGGPAGLSAGLYAARGGANAALYEALFTGGQAVKTHRIDNYPGFADGVEGFELGMKLEQHAARFGLPVEYAGVARLELSDDVKRIELSDGRTVETKALILAMGAKPRTLGLAREEELIGRGVSYCATCDGGFFRGRTAAVVGGGDAALEDALYLSEILREVTLIHRRDTFRADGILVRRIREKGNIRILTPYRPLEITGGRKVDGIRLAHTQTGEERRVDCDAVFVAVGNVPNTAYLAGLADLDEAGYVLAGEDCRTKTPGLYVAGDLRRKPLYQIVTAAADGAVAAKAAAN